MNPRGAVLGFGIVVLALLSISAKANALAFSFCNRHTVTFFPLAAELSNLYQCNRARCAGATSQFEVKQIAGYNNPGDINQWLVSTSDANASYTPAQQDSIIQQARSLANSNRPAGKVVFNIQFFRDIIVPNNTAGYFIGANVTYARCAKRPPPS